MRAMIVDEAVKESVKQVVEWAEAHPIPTDDLRKMIEGTLPPIGNDPKYVCHIPVGFTCVFSTEMQLPPLNKTRHLSVSVDTPGRSPAIIVMLALMELFGFKGAQILQDAKEQKSEQLENPTQKIIDICDAIWTEDLEDGGQVVNVLQRYGTD